MAKVLIIEDNPTINMLLRSALTDEGYSVTQTYDGISGLKSLRADTPNLVMVDLTLPHLSGREVIEAMRSESDLKDLPVIVITGNLYSTEDFPKEGSYQALFFKPFELIDVMNQVTLLLS